MALENAVLIGSFDEPGLGSCCFEVPLAFGGVAVRLFCWGRVTSFSSGCWFDGPGRKPVKYVPCNKG